MDGSQVQKAVKHGTVATDMVICPKPSSGGVTLFSVETALDKYLLKWLV